MTTRRSLRARKAEAYCEGDIVEIISSTGKVSEGKLVSRITKSRPSKPRWLVEFAGTGSKEAEVDETSFGRLLRSQRNLLSAVSRAERKRNASISTSTDSDIEKMNITAANKNVEADGVVNAPLHNLSARARRMMQRQAKMGDIDQSDKSDSSKRKHSSSNTTSGPSKKGKQAKNEEVVKVKLNTGTLYLYRGAHPRAEFIRRY